MTSFCDRAFTRRPATGKNGECATSLPSGVTSAVLASYLSMQYAFAISCMSAGQRDDVLTELDSVESTASDFELESARSAAAEFEFDCAPSERVANAPSAMIPIGCRCISQFSISLALYTAQSRGPQCSLALKPHFPCRCDRKMCKRDTLERIPFTSRPLWAAAWVRNLRP